MKEEFDVQGNIFEVSSLTPAIISISTTTMSYQLSTTGHVTTATEHQQSDMSHVTFETGVTSEIDRSGLRTVNR